MAESFKESDRSENEKTAIRIIEQMFADGGELSIRNSAYKIRPSQVEAAKGMMMALLGENHSIIEGPCGFGKTYAYLIPVIIEKWINKRSLGNNCPKTIIATGGISLQEQLCSKDLPSVIMSMENLRQKYFSDIKMTKFALFKGRQNFICPLKFTINGDIIKNDSKEHYEQICKVQKTSGDLSDLNFSLPDRIRNLCVCSEAEECKGSKCAMYNECPYIKQKRMVAESDIVVCNYHILFSALNAPILPKFDTLIWDEAHESIDIFRNLNTENISEKWLSNLSGNITKVLGTRVGKECIEQLYDTGNSLAKAVIDFSNAKNPQMDFIRDLKTTLNDYILCIARFVGINLSTPFNDTKLVHEGSYSDKDRAIRDDLVFKLKFIRDLFSIVAENANSIIEDEYEDDSTIIDDATYCKSVATLISDNVIKRIHFLERSDTTEKDYAYYIKKSVNGGDIVLDYERMPVDVSDIIYDIFLKPEVERKNIFTSATISTGGNMEFFKRETGLDKCNDVFEFIGQSPFNLTEQELWYLPDPCVDGNKSEFQNYFNNTVTNIIKSAKEGIMILTTSVTSMNQTYELVKSVLLSLNAKTAVLKQGEMPRTKLLQKFKDDGKAILVATKSFFTGIDIPGQALQCLVIDKLPFASPDDPVVMHLSCKRGANCFMDYQIPKMIITLKQAVGRGVRSIDDKCIICIADGRMATARYKGKIGKSFNYDKTATRNIEDVVNFLK